MLDAGLDLADAVHAEEEKYRPEGLALTQVWLKLSEPWMDAAVVSLRSQGFFLGGVLPRWFDDDALMVQKVVGTPNWAGIQLLTDRSKTLVDIVRKDWGQVTTA
ncbi:MAG: hypothetical protein CSYNP_00634 [Syntrophus sp. SKADARSKE-3]|nr:hypothetical protein [Syntrophus sp. SKADARSKE-3]